MINVKRIQKINPQDITAPKKHYLHAVGSGVTDLERLAYLISNQSTVREADCYAVVLSLVHNILDELAQGKIIKLDTLGTFKIGINSSGVVTKDEVSIRLINKSHINFRPDKRLKQLLKNVDYKLV
ncbi:HU family DNA-binding protein [Tenacibaculum sp. M341]|uniref:HU family DNA-binding protein n=1 Tax=Tenacibaculum sp. M341 TaxID=2530339 RepID=UPI00104C8F71|nr:HU family DNA-binding protein [Tenacibaculum sp. M341]TCI93800.1 DNA-binding protein [Tenacibaculum sp. M341]